MTSAQPSTDIKDAEAAQKALIEYEENLKRQLEAVAKNPTWKNWDNLGDAYMNLDKVEDALNSFFKALELKPQEVQVLAKVSMLYQGKGDREQAKKYADLNYSYQPEHYKPNYVLVGLLLDEGKYAEAKPYNEVCLKLYPNHPSSNFRMAMIYNALGEPEKAIECYKNGTKKVYDSALSYCNRGQCYYKLGMMKEAFADFKTAKSMIYDATSFTPSQKEYTRKALNAVLGAEEVSTQTEVELKKINDSQSSPISKKFTQRVQQLQAKKKEIQDKVVNELSKANKEADQSVNELERLKEEFKKELSEMKEEMTKMGKQMEKMDQRITNVENSLEEIKKELDNKLDDFKKKLSAELVKQDLPEESKIKLQGYFKAFLETFSSGYVTAQVVGSGQVQLDNSTYVTSILSTLASFAPLVGSALESGMKTIGEFFKSKEMITSARKMKGLAADTSELSQLIGKVGYEVAINKEQQDRILKITEKDLRQASGNLFKKIEKFCENLNETIDSYLYSKLYKLPAERLGHNDANVLIGKWLKSEMVPYDLEAQFLEEMMKRIGGENENGKEQNNLVSSSEKAKTVEGRSSCCNMF